MQWPKEKGKTLIYKTLHRELTTIEQHEPHKKTGGELRCPRRVSKAKTLITNKRSQKKTMKITIAVICFKSSIIGWLVVTSAIISFIFRTRASSTIYEECLQPMPTFWNIIFKEYMFLITRSTTLTKKKKKKKEGHPFDQGQAFLLLCTFSVFQTYRLNGR